MDNKHPSDTPGQPTSTEDQESAPSTQTQPSTKTPALFDKSPAISLTPFQGVSAVTRHGIPTMDTLDDDRDGESLNTDNLSPDEIASLELESYAEDSALDPEEDDATEMISAEDIGLVMEQSEANDTPGHAAPSFSTPRFPTSATKTPEAKPPSFGSLNAPNPFLRPKEQPGAPATTPPDGPKRTLLGMKAPDVSSINPVTPRPPQSTAPAPGSGAGAFSGRAMNFGAEQAYSSSRMPQPDGLPIDPLGVSGHLMPSPAPADQPEFEGADATEVYQGDPSSPQLGVPSFGSQPPARPAQQEFPVAEATIVGDTPSGLNLDGDDLDDDFAEQKTEVIHSPFEQEAIMPKLRVVEGPMTGQEFLLTGLRSTIGRGNNNSVMVEDLAMSRLHFEIIRNADDSYLLRDLGSANGTGLNGTRVKEAVLYHQDRLEAGKSIIVFEHPTSPARAQRHMVAVASATIEGQQPAAPIMPPAMQSGPDDQTRLAALQIDQSTRMFTRVALGAGALCIPLCFLLIFAIVSSSEEPAKPSATPPEAIQDNVGDTQRTRRAAELFLKGAEATKSRSWDEAKQYFEEAKRVDEGIDIDPQLNRIAREKEALEHLEAARKLEQADQILAAASKIPETSVYFDDAQKLIRLNRQDEVTIIHQKALALLQEDKLDEAEAALKELASLSPEHTGLETLEKDIQERRDAIAAELKKQEEEAAAQAKAEGIFKNSSSSSSSSSNSQGDLKEGYSLYKSKKFGSAESAFKRAGGKKGRALAKDTGTVASEWKSGERALSSSSWTKAISALETARNADRRINKAHRKSIGKDLAEAYANAGLDKLKKQDYRQARKYLANGEKLGVSNSTLTKLSRGLEDEAKKIYVRAVNKKKSDPDAALQLCRKIMLMLPSSSPTYKKAQKLIFDL